MNRKNIIWLFVIAIVPFLASSCQGSDDSESATSDYCYMSAFSLGSMKCAYHTTASDGTDSVYYTSFSGTLFPMTIDQKNLVIENKDSLPYGTRTSAVLVSATFQGVCAWRKKDLSGEDADTLWTSYSSSDSIDVSEPLSFAVVSTDGNSSRIYTVKVNVHQQDGDSMVWHRQADVAEFDNMAERRVFYLNDRVVVVGQTANGVVAATNIDGAWTVSDTGVDNADVDNICQCGGTIYMTDATGRLLASTDGIDWGVCGQADASMRLVAATDECLYGIAGENLYSTTDKYNWTRDSLDDQGMNLPLCNSRSVVYSQTNGMKRILLLGNRTSTESCVWSKGWSSKSTETNTVWTYYTPNGADVWHCPVMQNLNLQRYDDGLIAFGGKSADGTYEALEKIFYSVDNGVTWIPHYDIDVDTELQSEAKSAAHIVSAVDDSNNLWVIVDDHVWFGRLNRAGFARQDKD